MEAIKQSERKRSNLKEGGMARGSVKRKFDCGLRFDPWSLRRWL